MVEWKRLGEVCSDIIVPMRDRPKVFDGSIPWCRIEDIEGMYFNKSLSGLMVSEEVIRKMNLKVFPTGSVICSCSATLGVCAINTQPLITNQTFIGLVCSDKINNRFLYYYMLTRRNELQTLSTTGTIPYVSRQKFESIQIPIPSLSEQTRIVGILDTFTSAIDNLKEQIAQRRKQYEYYRDQLLDLEGKEGVEMKTLGELGEFIRGNGIQKNDFVEDGFGCIHYGQIHAKYGFYATETISKINESLYKKCKKAKKGDVVLATTSEDAEGVAKPFVWLGEEDVAVSGDAFIYHHCQIGKFIGHQFLTPRFMQFKVKYATGAKVVRISGDNMAKYEIPLPSLSEQQRIVSILDTFEASIQNLEAQLKEREKQYEYYRNKLLTFE